MQQGDKVKGERKWGCWSNKEAKARLKSSEFDHDTVSNIDSTN